jgi:UDP-N-acetylmuramoylalanine--D-glutamate ligase
VQNVLAAAAISYFAGIELSVISQVVKAFSGVAHRIEYCRRVDDVVYYNDSKGTNTDATEIALKAMERPVILIAGGDAKGQDFSGLVKSFPGKVKELILLGRDARMISDACDAIGYTDYTFCKDMEECVRQAAQDAAPEDVVLLSPACASWDMYDNFEQRGNHFRDCVNRL